MHIFHDSRDLRYRDPAGAAETGSAVSLSLEAEGAQSAVLRLWRDEEGETRVQMLEEEDGRYTARIMIPYEPGLIWYYFVITCPDGSVLYYGNKEDALGGEGEIYDHEPQSFQITVYEKTVLPEWYSNAIVYQIFPDRFAQGRDFEKKKDIFRGEHRNGPERVMTEDWYECPTYQKLENGDMLRWSFYGGTLEGIREKLSYIKSLGATAIYLNPIFEAASNHRYDTADYMNIDPLLGREEDFSRLCRDARLLGIHIILDGVFSHTGADSIYFDKFGNYGMGGAWIDKDSPYRSWYDFDESEAGYRSWWGVKDLPEVNELDPSYLEFICGENGVVAKWLRAGADGFRLDVADELPDAFIEAVRTRMKAVKPDSVLIGEVWEDASNKVSYFEKRKFLMGRELDSVMNYPLRAAVIDFALGRIDSNMLGRKLSSLWENYPASASYGALDLIGSHDRCRILTVLGGAEFICKADMPTFRLDEDSLKIAKERLKMLSVLQYSLPGVPCVYYGDEAGLEGHADPYNRKTYPWGREDKELLKHYRQLGRVYKAHSALRDGDLKVIDSGSAELFAFLREDKKEKLLVLVNRSDRPQIFESKELGYKTKIKALFTLIVVLEEKGKALPKR